MFDKKPVTIAVLIAGLLAGVFFAAHLRAKHIEEVAMHQIPVGLDAFKVEDSTPACGKWRDHMPSVRYPAAYAVYIEARKFYRSKMEWELTREELVGILKDVKWAAEKGDWGARALLAHFYINGLGTFEYNQVFDPQPDKSVEIARSAMMAGQAWGYYDLGVAYENGYGGLPHDVSIAWAYYLKAAKMGSPEAQMTLSQEYEKADKQEAAKAMKMCAFSQQHGPAAYELGLIEEVEDRFDSAIGFYQKGAKFGDQKSAAAVMLIFDQSVWYGLSKEKQDALRRMGILPDAERSRRYREISEALKLNPDLRFRRIDNAIPLPPAQLPPWEGISDALEEDKNDLPSYR